MKLGLVSFLALVSLTVVLLSAPNAGAVPSASGCNVLPADNVWNTPIDTLPLDANSTAYIGTIGTGAALKADFGAGLWDGGPIGIPTTTSDGTQTYSATFDYDDESDPGPYAVPLTAPIEGGSDSDGDRHAISIDTTHCKLYELYDAFPQANSWQAGSGAIYDLNSNALRPAGWTSADAAGLPIFPGLVRYDEVASGQINHAIRFTVPATRNTYVWPARHKASSNTGTQYPPMGERFRLKASFDISGFSPANQVILKALKKYGMIIADNGSAIYMSGAPDDRWNNDDLHKLGSVLGSQFEAVDESSLMIDPNSGQARQTGVATSTPPAATLTAVATSTAAAPTATTTATATKTATRTPTKTSTPVSTATKTSTPVPAVTVSISPTSATVRTGRTQQFTATVKNAGNTSVTWKVNGITNGNSTVGTISSSGLYRAPNNVPLPANVTISATSVQNTSKSASASVTVRR